MKDSYRRLPKLAKISLKPLSIGIEETAEPLCHPITVLVLNPEEALEGCESVDRRPDRDDGSLVAGLTLSVRHCIQGIEMKMPLSYSFPTIPQSAGF